VLTLHAEQGNSANTLTAFLVAAGICYNIQSDLACESSNNTLTHTQTAILPTGAIFLPGLGTTTQLILAAVCFGQR
jgi:hypothetical protein